jgi:hypothetical protein
MRRPTAPLYSTLAAPHCFIPYSYILPLCFILSNFVLPLCRAKNESMKLCRCASSNYVTLCHSI